MENNKITGNEPAYPMDFSHQGYSMQQGLTIRQQFAMAAMQGILSANPKETWVNIDMPVPEFIAELSVKQADALIAELNK